MNDDAKRMTCGNCGEDKHRLYVVPNKDFKGIAIECVGCGCISVSKLMVETTKFLVGETNARIGYTQSDEISLILMTEQFDSELIYDGRLFKMVSVLAARCSVFFNDKLAEYLPEKASQSPVFDCRVWNVPNQMEAVNTLVWREQDATRNSVSMAAQSMFSHKELQNKSCDEMQEMMFQQHGVNWSKYPDFFKRGTYVQRRKVTRKFTVDELDKLPLKHEARTNPDLMIERSEIRVIEMPPITKVANRVEVVFDGADAATESKE